MLQKNINIISVKSIAEFFLCIWIFIFSTGLTKIGALPFKAIILFTFLFLVTLLILKKNNRTIRYRLSLLIMSFWIFISLLIGIQNNYSSSTISHAGSLLPSILAVIFFILLYDNSRINIEKLGKVIYLTAITGVLVKIIIGLGSIFGLFSAISINQIMHDYFGSSSYDIDVLGGFMGLLPRIGNAGDLFYLIVFLFYAKKNTGVKVAIIWLLMLIFILISYSRYLMLIFFIITIYSFGLSFKNKPIKTTAAFTIFFLILTNSNFIDFDSIKSVLSDRFSGQIQSESDAIRQKIKDVVSVSFYDNVFFGIGMGGYVVNYIRSPFNLWQYELEYLAMLMQFGVFGFLFIIINYVFYVFRVIFYGYDSELIFPMALSLFAWLATPIQSSLFVSTQSSLIVLSIFLLSRKPIALNGKFMNRELHQI